LENRIINIAVVAEVARGLKELKDQMVFVGGSVISLYTDDPAADEIRPTGDIDMTVKIMGYSNWVVLNERLAQLDIYPDPYGHAICSYKYQDILIDIMPSEDGPLGPANKWYKAGFEDLQVVHALGEEIQILPAPCFLASKFEAFKDRGTDYRTSHDIEDVIYVIDNRMNIVSEIENSSTEIIDFLQVEIRKIIKSGMYEEILSSHIHPLIIDIRQIIVEEKIQKILAL
jgi:hypothetical protein